MAADLRALREDLPVPDDLEIERVRDEATLAASKDTLARGFGEGPVEAEWVGEVYRSIGLGDEVPWRHHPGHLRGGWSRPARLFLGAGVVRIYFVLAVQQARRRGIGAVLTLAPLRAARDMGCRVGVLGTPEMGRPVYCRLGFR